LGTACILFLRDFSAGRLGICVNPHCPSPLYVRSRRTQKCCDVPICQVYSHRTSANKHWRTRKEKQKVQSKKRIKKR
jgi:predicted RNA-binding Zn ribbon-like protein